eukprot:GHVU01178024.1.p1 GENE.GHVU01178024.1~~GHVU01178024.1.p1  ORF type:complete len:319 (-),score=21.35 GHVU01178024.1:161-1117(-)
MFSQTQVIPALLWMTILLECRCLDGKRRKNGITDPKLSKLSSHYYCQYHEADRGSCFLILERAAATPDLRNKKTAQKRYGLKRPYYRLLDNGTMDIEPLRPVLAESVEGWEDLISAEVESWGVNKTDARTKIVERKRRLSLGKEFDERLTKMRHSLTRGDPFFRKPKRRARLHVVRPEQGPYCELMKKDGPRVESLLTQVRERYSEEVLEITDTTITANVPLCEVFLTGPFQPILQILYARGGTLQSECHHRFWQHCDLLKNEKRLSDKYGGDGFLGGFPKWDEKGFLEVIDELMNPRPDYAAVRGGGLSYRLPPPHE